MPEAWPTALFTVPPCGFLSSYGKDYEENEEFSLDVSCLRRLSTRNWRCRKGVQTGDINMRGSNERVLSKAYGHSSGEQEKRSAVKNRDQKEGEW